MSEEKNFNDFKLKFKTKSLTVKKMRYWSFSIRPAQPTFGSLILFSNTPKSSLSQLSQEEYTELGESLNIFSNHSEKNLNAFKTNIYMLMLVDKHLHFHLFPRYDKPINGMFNLDIFWPSPISDLSKSFFDPNDDELIKKSKLING